MPGQNLTRAEASERSAAIQVHHYDVSLDLTTSEHTFTSITTVTFDATPGATDTFIDLIASHVHDVVLNGVSLDPQRVFQDSRVELSNLQPSNTLRVVAECTYMNTGEGLHRFVDPVDNEAYLYSQFEVADTRRMFAVFEQPDLKATFEFHVTAPAHWQVISNSPTPNPVPSDDGALTWHFAPTDVLPCYVTALIAGPYHKVTSELTSSDGRTIPLGIYCRASLAEHLDPEEIFEVTRQGFAFYEEKFDRPYPYEKYDQLFVPEFNAGAMENAGAVTFLESYVFRGQVPQALVERRAITILHELAHMWFGDLVTMAWWNDLWLNESFAEYASHWACAQATQWRNAWTTFTALEKSWAYSQDQLSTTHPIVAPINDLADVEVNFDGITYAKGASVLKQLVAWVGLDAFTAGIRTYFAKHAYGNTVLDDLLTELEATSGRDLREWSALWLEQSGVNTLHTELVTNEDGVITSMQLRQTAPAEFPVLRPHRLVIGGYDLNPDSGTFQQTQRVEVDVSGEITDITELVGQVRPDVLLINDEDLTYTKVRLDELSLRNATKNISAFTNSLTRTLVWNLAWDLTRDAAWPTSRYLDTVLRHIGQETDSSVLQVLLRQVSTAVDYYTDPAHRTATSELVATELWNLALAAEPGSDAALQFAQAFIARAATAEQLTTLRQLLSGAPLLRDLEIDTDLRWQIITTLVSHGDTNLIGPAMKEDPSATGRRFAQTARSARPLAEAKEEVWRVVVQEGSLPNALQKAAITGFGRTVDPALLAPYVSKYFGSLQAVWENRTHEMASSIVEGLYPLALVDIDDRFGVDVVGATEQFLTELGEQHPALRRLVQENRDAALRALAAQRADRPGS